MKFTLLYFKIQVQFTLFASNGGAADQLILNVILTHTNIEFIFLYFFIRPDSILTVVFNILIFYSQMC